MRELGKLLATTKAVKWGMKLQVGIHLHILPASQQGSLSELLVHGCACAGGSLLTPPATCSSQMTAGVGYSTSVTGLWTRGNAATHASSGFGSAPKSQPCSRWDVRSSSGAFPAGPASPGEGHHLQPSPTTAPQRMVPGQGATQHLARTEARSLLTAHPCARRGATALGSPGRHKWLLQSVSVTRGHPKQLLHWWGNN